VVPSARALHADVLRPFSRSVAVSGARILVEIPSRRAGDAVIRDSLLGAGGSLRRITGLTGPVALAGTDGSPIQLRLNAFAAGASPTKTTAVYLTVLVSCLPGSLDAW